MNSHSAAGATGEALAKRFLEEKKYLPIDSNWRCRAGEIDLIMLDGEVLVFAEVKLRRSRIAGAAEESVSEAKARRLLTAGEWFVSEHPEHADRFWRIDIVAITMGDSGGPVRITHVQNAITVG